MKTYRFEQSKECNHCVPLTLTRHLGDFPLANRSLRQHQVSALLACSLVEKSENVSDSVDFEINSGAWFDLDELAAYIADTSCRSLRQTDGELLIQRSGGENELIAKQSFVITYSWDLLRANVAAMSMQQVYSGASTAHGSHYIDGRLQVGTGTKILPGVVIEGDVIIGDHCKIGPNCYIRGSTSIGNHCHVGQAVEIKNSIILSGTNVGHLSYVGDSILGENVNFGAGTITSNLRHDGRTQFSRINGNKINTGRRKLGAIIGDGVHTGIHTSIYPGIKLWPKTSTLPGAIINRDIHN